MSARELLASYAGRRLRDAWRPGPPRLPASLSLRAGSVPAAEIGRFAERYPQQVAEVVGAAERAMRGIVPLFGRPCEVGLTIDWHGDPFSRRRWPADAAIDVLTVRDDPKPVWELNRQQWLPTLALAYRLTGDEAFARRALDDIDSWIRQNPWRTGINWTAPSELALRQISWLATARLLEATPAFQADARSRMAAALFRQAAYVASHLSLGSSANNHLAAEAIGLLLSGEALGVGAWRRAGESHLSSLAPRLFREDGTGAEQSIAYLVQTLEYYLLAAAVSSRLRSDPKVRQRLAAAARFLQALTADGAAPPAIGDDDSGSVLWLGWSHPRVGSIIDAAAALTGGQAPLASGWERDPWLHWFGPSAEGREGGEGEAPSAVGFPAGGYYELDARGPDGDATLWFRCGPLGLAPLAGHAHCDALAVDVRSGGRELIADSGTFTYRPERGWRAYFRGTSAHSTVRVDGVEQSAYAGPFLVVRRADARCLRWAPGEGVAGALDLANGCRHTRQVSLADGGRAFEIADEIEGRGAHLAELFFHAPPDAAVRVEEDGRVRITREGRALALRLPPGCVPQLYFGDGALPLGWHSRTYGERTPCFTIVARVRFEGRVALTTVMEPGPCAG